VKLLRVFRAALSAPVAAWNAGIRIVRHGVRDGPGAAYAEARRVVAAATAVAGYPEWVRGFDTPERAELDAQRRDFASSTRRPRISIVMPVCDPPVDALRAALASVRAQTYSEWELCVADDASRDPSVIAILDEQSAEPRIRLVRRSQRGHISRASNDGLGIASGTYVAFLDHDDVLAPDALARFASHLAAHPRHRLVYSDEDKLDGAGGRCEPYFKPEFDPDLLLGQNYLCHLVVAELALVAEVGGMRPGFEGAQDHDLWLRCTERLAAHEIGHVPRVLYHWRKSAVSTSATLDAKPYAVAAGLRAVEEHLTRTGVAAEVRVVPGGHFRVVRHVPEPQPSVSIVIPTRDRVDLLARCVESIRARTGYASFEIVVADNGSTSPETLAFLEQRVRAGEMRVVRYDGPFNYAAVNNHAIRYTHSDVVVLLNNDIEVIDGDWLRELVSHAVRPDVGCVGAMLYYPDDTIQHAGIVLGIGGVAGHAYPRWPRGSGGYFNRARLVQTMSAVTGACLAVRRAVYDEVGGLDETFAVAFNDVDFCLRVRARGYRNLWTPYAELYHHESASRGYEDTPSKRRRFDREAARMVRRWGPALRRDPAYNLNLSLVTEPFTLSPSGPRWADAPDAPAFVRR
jgi:GT2 family glycosyltransferase